MIVLELDPAVPPARILADADEELRRVVELAATLYDGNYDDLIEDLSRRAGGRPYCFRHDIDERSARSWVERIQAYEAVRGERLSDALAGGA